MRKEPRCRIQSSSGSILLMALTVEEYEDAYREALRCLADVCRIGAPTRVEGTRRCVINGVSLADSEVLRLFWGEAIAAEILQRP